MSLSNTTVATTYAGDGSTTTLPITMTILANTQVKVSRYNTATAVTEELVQGTDFTVTGGNPGTNVEMTTAPTTDHQITVYRSTPKTQTIDYIGSGAFLAEDHETGMDRMVMMIQEIARDVSLISSSAVAGDGAFIALDAQSVAAVGTVTVSTNQRMMKRISGSGGAVTASTSTPVADGSIDGQELLLIGSSDTNTLTIEAQGNVDLNGNITFYANTVLSLLWDLTNSKWVEIFRRG